MTLLSKDPMCQLGTNQQLFPDILQVDKRCLWAVKPILSKVASKVASRIKVLHLAIPFHTTRHNSYNGACVEVTIFFLQKDIFMVNKMLTHTFVVGNESLLMSNIHLLQQFNYLVTGAVTVLKTQWHVS